MAVLNMAAARPDTTVASSATFRDLPIHRDIVRALTAMRFLRPSPIQLHALPVALFGNDVVGQAKSGTGKTAVFGITAIEHAIRYVEKRRQRSEKLVAGDPLALIVAPTREIAVQIETVLRQLAQFRPEIVIRTCIGGLAVSQDQVRIVAFIVRIVGWCRCFDPKRNAALAGWGRCTYQRDAILWWARQGVSRHSWTSVLCQARPFACWYSMKLTNSWRATLRKM